MDSKRQTQVAGLVQKELANILQFKFNGLVPGRLLTITGVRMSPDLGLAKIYLSIFPSTDGQSIIKEINTNVSRIRYELGNAIRNDVRRVPRGQLMVHASVQVLHGHHPAEVIHRLGQHVRYMLSVGIDVGFRDIEVERIEKALKS